MVTVKQAAQQLGHKYTSRVYGLIDQKRLEVSKTDNGLMVSEPSLKKYLEQRGNRGPKKAAKAKQTKKSRSRKVGFSKAQQVGESKGSGDAAA